jgi:hypothetical protein
VEVEFDVAVDDHLAASAFLMHHSAVARRIYARRMMIHCAVLAVAAVLTLFIWMMPGSAPPETTWSAGFLVFYVVLLATARFRRRKASERVNARLLGERHPALTEGRRRVVLSEEGVALEADAFRMWYRWDVANEVVVADDWLHILLGGGAGLFVPKRAFPSESEFRTFVEAAEGYHKAASG